MERVGALAAKEFQVGPSSRSYGLCLQSRLGAAQKKKSNAKRGGKRSIGGHERRLSVAAHHATQTNWKRRVISVVICIFEGKSRDINDETPYWHLVHLLS